MSFATILSRLRLELRDEGTRFTAALTVDASRSTFIDLPVQFIDGAQLEVVLSHNATPQVLSYPTDYTYDERQGHLYLTDPPPVGDRIIVTGYHYRYFTDAQLAEFIHTAFEEHTHNRNPPLYYDAGPPATPSTGTRVLPPIEEYLVVLLAMIEALWVLATDYSFEIDIMTPDGVQIPRQQRWNMVMQMIQQRTAEYQDLAQQLNVGIHRIEMFTLRRVSRSTNRYVPVYVAKEYDDLSATPQRIYPEIGPGTL